MPPASRTSRNVSPRAQLAAMAPWQSAGARFSRNTSPTSNKPRAVTATGLFVCAVASVLLFLFHVSSGTAQMRPPRRQEGDAQSRPPIPASNQVAATPLPKEKHQEATPKLVLPELGEYRNSSSECDILYPASLQFTTVGDRCVFPFKYQGVWIPDCRHGFCATRVNTLGVSRALGNCTTTNPVSSDYSCVGVENPRRCDNDNATITDATCNSIIEKGTCVCRGRHGTSRHTVKCKKISCASVCRNVFEDVMSSSHAAAHAKDSSSLIKKLGELARKHEPNKTNLRMWRQFVDDLPNGDKPPAHWCGKGIAIMAGSVGTLPQALATVSFLRGYIDTPIPVEIWQASDEETVHSEEMKAALHQLGVVIRTLPEEARSASLRDMFSLKPAVVLASAFDEVLFLDADAMPLVDPMEIFQIREQQESAVFWPDLWTLLYDAKIWDAIGGWPFGESKHAPSQESGLMVVCKSCGGWKPLALAFYFNYHNNVYYNSMYFGHYLEKSCRSSKCARGHSVPGIGDKDTFQIAWMALKERFTMMPPAALGGTMLPFKELVCGTSFLHYNKNNRMIALHHNSNKWWWKDFQMGKWAATRNALLLTHFSQYKVPSLAWRADGVNQWRSVTYSTRADAGKQQPPSGARWCIIYKGETNQGRIEHEVGWPVEQILLRFFSTMYIAPWLVQWVLENQRESAMFKCVTRMGWMTMKDAEITEDDNLRNIVISNLHKRGKGTVPKLQSYGDGQLFQLCSKLIDGIEEREPDRILRDDSTELPKEEKALGEEKQDDAHQDHHDQQHHEQQHHDERAHAQHHTEDMHHDGDHAAKEGMHAQEEKK